MGLLEDASGEVGGHGTQPLSLGGLSFIIYIISLRRCLRLVNMHSGGLLTFLNLSTCSMRKKLTLDPLGARVVTSYSPNIPHAKFYPDLSLISTNGNPSKAPQVLPTIPIYRLTLVSPSSEDPHLVLAQLLGVGFQIGMAPSFPNLPPEKHYREMLRDKPYPSCLQRRASVSVITSGTTYLVLSAETVLSPGYAG